MHQEESSPAIAAARERFAAYLAQRGVDMANTNLVERPELHAPPLYAFAAVGNQGTQRFYLRGLASAERVLTRDEPQPFQSYLMLVRPQEWPTIDAVRIVETYRMLELPAASAPAEDGWPILYAEQLAAAPVAHLAEPPSLPEVERVGEIIQVGVWFQLEPGARFEHWSFRLHADGSFELERRSAAYQKPRPAIVE